jgi:primosomal replication protein N''
LISGVRSLIDYAMQKVQCTSLDFHYRALKKELINFSNMVFYNGRLNMCDAPVKSNDGLKLVNVQGSLVNGVNQVEADTIVKKITEICDSKEKHGSIGVITMTQEQADYIKRKLTASESRFVINELQKINYETGEDISIFVKTIDDVQGEERDNIFITIG